ncbi:hypothetical protein [uncultured Chryseobacterium sp.]|uniref:hypothetical protein n=1 Tax=uncultured Chryseobacterium sp. TaxID=259322 RepID=UPI0026003DD1|nr:hypothetical protein [uncultured Chryseobacterium sp.]
MEKEKFRIEIIDFLPHYKQFEVGKYADGTPACLGDVVHMNGREGNWFVAYRYGKVMLKQVGFMAMIGSLKIDNGDFSDVEKTNIIGAGMDYLIIGYTNEKLYQELKNKGVI